MPFGVRVNFIIASVCGKKTFFGAFLEFKYAKYGSPSFCKGSKRILSSFFTGAQTSKSPAIFLAMPASASF